ncbi:hypothetical protein D3C72_2474320 [compost metagenome]
MHSKFLASSARSASIRSGRKLNGTSNGDWSLSNGVYEAHCSLCVALATSGRITGLPRPYQKPQRANSPSRQANR